MTNIPKGKYAWAVKVGEKGQIVLPKEAREIFNIRAGETILLLGDIKRGIAIPPQGAFDDILKKIYSEKEDDRI